MLTRRQKDVFDFISAFEKEHGIAPSMREIAAGVQLASPSTAHKHVQALREKGHLEASVPKRKDPRTENLKNKNSGWRTHTTKKKNDHLQSLDDFCQITVIGKLIHGNIELFASITTHLLPKSLLVNDSTYYGFIIADNSFADQLLVAGDLLVIDTESPLRPGDTVFMNDKKRGAIIEEYSPRIKSGAGKTKDLSGKVVLNLRIFKI